MKKLLFIVVSILNVATTYAQTSSDFMQAYKVADCVIPFDVSDAGTEYKVNWGMDTAWNWDFNVNRGVAHIGKENLSIGRVAYQPTLLVTTNDDGSYELTAAQKAALKSRCDNIKNLTGVTRINITADQEAYLNEDHPEYRTNYLGNWYEWYKCLKASVKYCQELGMEVYSVSPFNEPDYGDGYTWGWLEGYKSDFLQFCKWIREDSFFDGIRISGGNTLNCDQALPWYNYLKDYLDEGNTHQLAGSFDNYATFFSTVKADGKVATADELHNVGEAIVGVNYGMENGIWWAFDAKARGQFCIDSNEGVRIGYGEDRTHWTSGAVYRNDSTNEIHGYLGSSERQANNSSFAFVSTTKDVYFNGYGPTRMWIYDLPGGTGYQKGQINAEYLFDITYGEDVAPGVIDGTYQIMNMSSRKMLTANGTSNVTSTSRKTSGTSQQWTVAPIQKSGDCSYYSIDNAGNTSLHLNLLNNNLSSGANVICYNAGHADNEQWYIKYAGDGCYYIINRLSNKYLYCSSTSTNTAVTLVNAPTSSTSASILKRYMWRFMPTDCKADVTAPAAPSDIVVGQQSSSIKVSWGAPADNDVTSYNILRGEDGEWNTIGRVITETSFIDNTAIDGHSYSYKVVAVDYAGNRSEPTAEANINVSSDKALICQLQFDNSLQDNSLNRYDAKIYGDPSYSSVGTLVKSGTASVYLKGETYAMVPYAAATQKEMTVATWLRLGTVSNWQRVFDFGNGSDQYMFFTPSNGSEMRFVMKNGGDEQILTNGKKLSSARWYHLAVTLKPLSDGKVQAILYIDGEAVAQSDEFTITAADIAPSLCYIGRSMFLADPLFSGRIDDFRIYNYALTADEIASVMEDTGEVAEELVTGIEEVPATSDSKTTGIYDLSGRRVTTMTKGFYVKDGQKMFVK